MAAQVDIATYVHGVALMKARDGADPLSWYYQSRMHGNPGGTERTGRELQDFSQCQHGTWWFLPWHRMYLLQFERIIGHLTETPSFALPYWDYASPAQAVVPPAFLDAKSSLYDETRDASRHLSEQPQTWIRAETFSLLGGGVAKTPTHHGELPGLMELYPHNVIRGWVGGDMAGFQSPLDPLFWIHHCNVDRLWEVWRDQPRHTNPADNDWLNTSFEFPDPIAGRKSWTVRDVLTPTEVGYDYDSLSLPVRRRDLVTTVTIMGPSGDFEDEDFGSLEDALAGSAEHLHPLTDEGIELVGASSSTSRRTSAREGADVTPEKPIQMPVKLEGLNVIESVPPTLLLRLENVGINGGDASDMWNVFASVNDGPRRLVGIIVPFGLAGLTERGGRQTLTFDVSAFAAELAAAPGSGLRVKCEPVDDSVQQEPFWERTAIYKAGG